MTVDVEGQEYGQVEYVDEYEIDGGDGWDNEEEEAWEAGGGGWVEGVEQ